MSIWKTAKFVRKGNYLYGSFIKQPEVDGYIKSTNPGDLRDVLGKFPFSATSADSAVGCAREAFPAWHRAGLGTRMLCLHRYRDQLAANINALSSFITRETGKPFWEAHAEVLATIKRVDVTLEHGPPQLDGWQLTELQGGFEFHPRGVVVVLGPYSLPLLIPNTHIIPALLSGNVIVFKPSKYTPAIGQMIGEMIDRARFPRGVFNMVQGSGKVVGSRLAVLPDVDAIHLDGSLETGIELRKLTLRQPWKRLVLNMCGRGAAIVLDDADLDKAAYEILVGAFLTTGQRRSSTTRVIVTRRLADKLEQRLVQVLGQLSIGYGYSDNIYMGPLISEASRRRYVSYLQGIKKEGHTLLVEGGRLGMSPRGYYVSPALIKIDRSVERQYMTSESVAGPALELFQVEDFQEAVAVHNESRSRLVTALFTYNKEWIAEAKLLLQTGVLNLNRSTVSVSARLPLEGQQAASNGVAMGLYAIRATVYPLSYLEDNRSFDRDAVMPGIQWPEDVPAPEVTAPIDADGQAHVLDGTISDLLIPQEEITEIMARPDALDGVGDGVQRLGEGEHSSAGQSGRADDSREGSPQAPVFERSAHEKDGPLPPPVPDSAV